MQQSIPAQTHRAPGAAAERPRVALLVLAWAVSGLAACRPAPTPTGQPASQTEPADPPRQRQGAAKKLVAVSLEPLAYFVERIGSPMVSVVSVIPPGAAHTFEPGMRQIAALDQAAAYVKVGHPAFVFESAWLDKLLAGRPELQIMDASAGLTGGLDEDPHIWLSPRGGRVIAANVGAGLIALLPQHRGELEANLRSLLADIDALDAHFQRVLAGKRGGTFYTVHAAWGYLAADFGLRQVALEHGAKHTDAHNLRDIVDEARRKGAKKVLVQKQFDPAPGQLLANEVGAMVLEVDPLTRAWLSNMHSVADAFAEAVAP